MNTITVIAISVIIVLQTIFMILEMFLWNTSSGRKIFGTSKDFAQQSATLAANQGLYNGFLAAGLLWGLISSGGFDALIFFLGCIIIAGLYGAATANVSILFIQGLPAAVAMTLLILNQ